MLADASQRNSKSTIRSGESDGGIEYQHVDPQRFVELALSTRKLLRDDRSSVGLRGLLDPETGRRFVIEEEKLFGALGHV
jgi:hypothetical protein